MYKFTRTDLLTTLKKAMAPLDKLSPVELDQLGREMHNAQREAADERSRKALHTMAEHGWYLDPTWLGGSETYVASLFEKLPEAKVDEFLCRQIEKSRPQSLEGLVKQFPDRERFFRQAFAAHERKEYALTIPLLLMQADGICEELLAVQLHARERTGGKMALATKLEEVANLYIEPLLEPHPVAHNVKERAAIGSTLILNRHTVLHGESTDFDSYENSCRAISYVRFVGWVLESAARALSSSPV